MELAIAIYGAVVATLALAWGIYLWSRSRRPDVEVRPGESVTVEGVKLTASVTNRGNHAVRIDWYTFRPQTKPGQPFPVFDGRDVGPIPPSDGVVVEASIQDIFGWEPGEALVAEVSLTTGDSFRSREWVPSRVSEAVANEWFDEQ